MSENNKGKRPTPTGNMARQAVLDNIYNDERTDPEKGTNDGNFPGVDIDPATGKVSTAQYDQKKSDEQPVADKGEPEQTVVAEEQSVNEVDQTAAQAVQTEQEVESEPLKPLKVNGKEIDFTPEERDRLAQQAASAQERYMEAARIREEARAETERTAQREAELAERERALSERALPAQQLPHTSDAAQTDVATQAELRELTTKRAKAIVDMDEDRIAELDLQILEATNQQPQTQPSLTESDIDKRVEERLAAARQSEQNAAMSAADQMATDYANDTWYSANPEIAQDEQLLQFAQSQIRERVMQNPSGPVTQIMDQVAQEMNTRFNLKQKTGVDIEGRLAEKRTRASANVQSASASSTLNGAITSPDYHDVIAERRASRPGRFVPNPNQ